MSGQWPPAFEKGLPVFRLLLLPQFEQRSGGVFIVRNGRVPCCKLSQRERFAALFSLRFKPPDGRAVVHTIADVRNNHSQQRSQNNRDESGDNDPFATTSSGCAGRNRRRIHPNMILAEPLRL